MECIKSDNGENYNAPTGNVMLIHLATNIVIQ